MNRATIAAFALGAAMLFPNWAVAHVLRLDDVQPSQLTNDEREQLTREFLPIVHDCPQTPATFHAQSMSEVVLERACAYLKEIEDNFHAMMQTDPREARLGIDGDYYSRADILAFDRVTVEDLDDYTSQFYGHIFEGQRYVASRFVEGTNIQSRPRVFPGLFNSVGANFRPDLDPKYYFPALEHEYVHYLDDRFFGLVTTGVKAMFEGLASHLQRLPEDWYGHLYHGTIERWIGDGSSLLTINTIYYEEIDKRIQYGGGSLLIRFLVEEHPQVILDIKEILHRPRSREHLNAYNDYIEQVFPALESDFDNWQRGFIPLTIREIGPITIVSGDQNNLISMVYPFYTSQEVTLDVSLSASGVIATYHDRYWMHLYGLRAGTVEVTVTATMPDGDSAEQTFTVTVVKALQTKDITVRDPVSIEEGEKAINLASYFSGPALGDVEFTVASNDTDVARVAVRGGRLIVTAVAVGEAEVTVRTDYYGRQTTQTFTVTITDDCPAYLCRGFFNGWRWLLLEDGQAATETTPTE